MKRLLSVVLSLTLILTLLPVNAAAASSYSASKSLEYAKGHWDDGKGLCAEFVSNCLKAGGLTSWNRECTNLYNQLNKEVVNGAKIASVQNLTVSGNYIKVSQNTGKVSKGDVLFWYCSYCKAHPEADSVGGPHQHTALISDVSGTYVKVYQHNSAKNNETAWVGNCYECGSRYSDMVLIHFGASSAASDDPTVEEYFDCDVQINTTNGKTVNLYKNIGDSSRYDYFSKGQTVYSTKGARVSDGSIWYQVQASSGGKAVTVWLNAASSGVSVIDQKVSSSLSFSPNSVNLRPKSNATVSVDFSGDGIQTLNCSTSNGNVCTANWENIDWRNGDARLTVYAQGPGTATITVNFLDEGGKKFYSKGFDVTVSNYDARISVSPSRVSLDLSKNDSQTVSVTIGGTYPSGVQISTESSGVAEGTWTVDAMRDGRAEMKVSAKEIGTGKIIYRIKGSDGTTYASTTLDVTATAPTYTVSYSANGGSDAPSRQTKEYNKSLTISSQEPTRVGYCFNGWSTSSTAYYPDYPSGSTYTKNLDLTLYAVWVPASGVQYTVKHYLDDGDGFRLEDTDTFIGTTGDVVSPSPREYLGYTVPQTKSARIAADGSALIEYFYTARSHTVTLRSGEGIDSVSGKGTYQYGDHVTVSAEVAEGYEWYQWTGDGQIQGSVEREYTFTMPDEDVDLEATAKKIIYHHDLDYTPPKDATEESEGRTEYWYCSSCDKYFADANAEKEINLAETVIEKLEHTHNLTHYPAVPSTCTEEGNLEYWQCGSCGKYFSDASAAHQTTGSRVALRALGHNFENGICVRDGAADPDYTAPPPQVSEVHMEKQTIYFQGQFSDVDADQWYTDSIAEAYELGLMKGTSDDTFAPYGDVTLAEAITMACRIHSIYTTGYESFVQSGEKWYQVYLDYAYQNGIISWAYYNADVEHKATRAQFAEIFSNALPEDALTSINTVDDSAIPDVFMESDYAPYVYMLYRAGILTGGDATGTFSPQTYITRAEAAAIVSRMAESNNRVRFSMKK